MVPCSPPWGANGGERNIASPSAPTSTPVSISFRLLFPPVVPLTTIELDLRFKGTSLRNIWQAKLIPGLPALLRVEAHQDTNLFGSYSNQAAVGQRPGAGDKRAHDAAGDEQNGQVEQNAN